MWTFSQLGHVCSSGWKTARAYSCNLFWRCTCSNVESGVGWGGVGQERSSYCGTAVSTLVTHGAPCYPKLTYENNAGHEASNHSKTFSGIKKKNGAYSWPTEVDGTWNMFENSISSSLRTHKMVLSILTCFRDSNLAMEMDNRTPKDYLSLTGHALSERLDGPWPKWKLTTVLRTESPANTTFPGTTQNNFHDKMSTTPQRQALCKNAHSH